MYLFNTYDYIQHSIFIFATFFVACILCIQSQYSKYKAKKTGEVKSGIITAGMHMISVIFWSMCAVLSIYMILVEWGVLKPFF